MLTIMSSSLIYSIQCKVFLQQSAVLPAICTQPSA